MKKENIALLTIIILGLGLSTIPYIVGYLVQPDDAQFMGIVSDVPDWTQYMAWMRASTRGVIIENVLTPEAQDPTFFNLQWFVLGRLGAWFHLSPALSAQVFRILSSLFFMLLTYQLCRAYFKDQAPAAWGSWLLINFSAGLGWILVIEKRFSGALKYPLDVYVAEPISFQNMIIFPHFLMAAALILLTFKLAVVAIERERLPYALLGGLVGLVLGLTHAYDLIIVYGVLGAFVLVLILRDGFSWFPIGVVGLMTAISLPPAAYFFYLTTTDPLWSEVLAQFKNAAVYTPNPLHLIILLGVPLILTVFTFDGLFPLSGKTRWKLLIRVWFVVNFFLLYIPTDFQIHMLSGWQIPLGILTIEGLFDHLWPSLRERVNLDGLFPRLRADGLQWLLVIALFLSVAPHNAYLLIWRVREVLRTEHTHYLYKDELQALEWLEKNSDPSEVVLAALEVGQYVPGIAGNKTYLGHWAQTVDFYTKQSNVAAFFQQETPEDERRAILSQFDVDYVFYGREEKALGDLDPSQLPYLSLAFEASDTIVYRTTLDNKP